MTSFKHKYKNWQNVPSHVPAPPGTEFIVPGGPFSLDWVFTFGKYRRAMRTLEQVIDEDPEYVQWCLTNVVGFSMGPGAHMALDHSFSKHRSDEPPEEFEELDD